MTFDYGSKHNAREIAWAKVHCGRLGIRHIVIKLDFMQKYFTSSLLEGGDEIPEGHYADENMKSTVVPFRNGIMLSVAAGIAESNGLKKYSSPITAATIRYTPTAVRNSSGQWTGR